MVLFSESSSRILMYYCLSQVIISDISFSLRFLIENDVNGVILKADTIIPAVKTIVDLGRKTIIQTFVAALVRLGYVF